MEKTMLSVGLDLGTSTTQLVLSRLHVRNTAAGFTVPKLAITETDVLYRSPIHFTPLLSDTQIDAEAIRLLVDADYKQAGIDPKTIETGAVIITGETARKDNARQVLDALAGYAGDFVVATAGPDLEGILAAKGAGCDVYSREHRCGVLNFDIGGGTSNLCLFEKGECRDTGCLNVGGRLIKLSEDAKITYLSPVLRGRYPLAVGTVATPERLRPVIADLVAVLEQAAGLRPKTALCEHFITNKLPLLPEESPIFSFSGGVADLIYTRTPPHWTAFGDLGVLLGRAIKESALLQGKWIRPQETIRATVVGAGSHTTTLSGSTIAYAGIEFPLKNLPVLALSAAEEALPASELAEILAEKLRWFWEDAAPSPLLVALPGQVSPGFGEILRLAEGLTRGLAPLQEAGLPLLVCVAADMGKALGNAMLARLPPPKKLLCLDGLSLQTGGYLDVGSPVGSALPVVIKTLLFTS